MIENRNLWVLSLESENARLREMLAKADLMRPTTFSLDEAVQAEKSHGENREENLEDDSG